MDPNAKKIVAGLGGALGCALLAIAFLLGRVSSPPPSAISANPAPLASDPRPATAPILATGAQPPAGQPSTSDESPATAPLEAPRPAQSFQSVPPAGDSSSAQAAVAPPVPGNGAAPSRVAVAAYFAEVDRVDDVGAGDPQGFAQALMKSVASGDFSGFDDLLSKARAQRDRLRALAPPPPCIEHHRLALSLSNESVAMLEKMRGALAQNDTTALLAMATQGQTLEAKANQLKAMGDALKKQAGM